MFFSYAIILRRYKIYTVQRLQNDISDTWNFYMHFTFISRDYICTLADSRSFFENSNNLLIFVDVQYENQKILIFEWRFSVICKKM